MRGAQARLENIRAKQQMKKIRSLKKSGQHIVSKWQKTDVLMQNAYTRKFIPKTMKLTEANLKSMLDQFKMVYVKPIHGTYGMGVIRIEKHNEQGLISYNYQQGETKKYFHTFTAMYQSIIKHKLNRNYIIQQGIHLLRYKKRLCDLRIMVQRGLKGSWESTGIIARVAHPRKIVTNYHNGGTPMSFEKIFSPFLENEQIKEFKQILNRFGREIAVTMSRKYPKLNMLGIDVGVDRKLYPWIIEVNTNPDVYLFKNLKNKAIFHKMYRYAKHLKRI